MYDQERAMTEPAIGREEPQPIETPRTITYSEIIEGLTNQQVLQHHEMRIEFLDKGCIVRIGCKSIAFTTVEEAMRSINSYVNDPKTEAKRWREQFNMK